MFKKLIAPLLMAYFLICAQDTFAIERIIYSPPSPKVNEEITFRAVGWDNTGCILWLFGDGDLDEDARDPYTTSHSYSRAGTYTVKAYYGCDPSATPTTTTVVVREPVGPAAPFSISFIQLRFEDGKGYKTVSRNTPNLRAYVDIKYQGTGTFRFQWLVDGKPFEIQSQGLFFAQHATFQTQKPLPTQINGAHDVSLRILQPRVTFEIPVIRYFVSTVEGELTSLSPVVDIFVTSALNEDGNSLQLILGEVQAPAKQHILLTGSIVNKHGEALIGGRLDIYLDNELVDSQMIRELPARSGKRFETSIYNPSDISKEVRFVLNDASGQQLQVATIILNPVPVGLALKPLPPGVIIDFRARPRHIRDDSRDIVVEYHVENVKEAYLFVQWSYEEKGFFGPFRVQKFKYLKTLNPKKDQDRMLRSLPEIHQEPHQIPEGRPTQSFVYGIHGKYYDPATRKNEDFVVSELLQKYVTIKGFEPTVVIKDWEFVQTGTVLIAQDGAAHVDYNNADPVSVTLKITLENPQRAVKLPDQSPLLVCQDVGVFSMSVRDLPKGSRNDDITIYGLDGCATKTVTQKITLPPGLLKHGDKTTSVKFTVEVDPSNRFPPLLTGEDKKREIRPEIFLFLPKPQQIVRNEPVIEDFSASPKSLFVGDGSIISWSVDHVHSGGIAEVDTIGGVPKKTIVNISNIPEGDLRSKGSIKVSPQKTTVYALYAYFYPDPPPPQGVDPVVRYLTISALPKGTFAGEKPLIQSFKADRISVKANEVVKLSYEFSFAGIAEIIDKANGSKTEIPVKDPGKVVSGVVEVKPKVMTTYELVCYNPNGVVRKNVTIAVQGGGMGAIPDSTP